MGRPRADDTEPIAVLRALDLEPLDPYPGSKARWRSRCTRCNNEVYPRLCNARRGHRNCPTCFRDPRTMPEDEAVAIMRAAGLTPLVPYPGSKHPWKARCDGCAREARPRLANLMSGQSGCWPCGVRRRAALLRLPEEEAVAAMRAAGLDPLESYQNTMTPWRCRCTTCGAEVFPTHNMVQKGTGGCGPCGRAKNGLARMRDSQEAVEVMIAAGLTPVEPYPGVAIPWACICGGCSRTVTPRLGGILAGQGGCKPCSWSLAREGSSAGVYLVWHSGLQAIKVGIGVARREKIARAEEHRRRGWTIDTAVIGFDSMRVAFDAESAVLNDWSSRGIGHFLEPKDMPHGGWTETAPYSPSELNRSRSLIAASVDRQALPLTGCA